MQPLLFDLSGCASNLWWAEIYDAIRASAKWVVGINQSDFK